MNKLFTKIATACVGLAMAVGVGVAVGSNDRALKADAANYESVFVLDGTDVQTNIDPEDAAASNYAKSQPVTQSSIDSQYSVTWEVFGNTTMNPWRLGGKGLSGVNRAIYSTTSIPDNVSKIDVYTGSTGSSLTVNSLTISVHSSSADAASGNNEIATTTATSNIAGKTISLVKEDSTSWANKFYRIVYNVTRTGTSGNGYVQFNRAEFLTESEKQDSSVTISNPTPFLLTVGDNDGHLSASTTPSGLGLTYSSSNNSVATIDSNGDITTVANGVTKLSASFAGNETYKASSANIDLTVLKNVASLPSSGSITISPSDLDKIGAGSGYVDYDGYHYSSVVDNDDIEIIWNSKNAMVQSELIQMQNGTSKIYNYSPINDLKSVNVTVSEGTYTLKYGSTIDAINDNSISASTKFFSIEATATLKISSISIAFGEVTPVTTYSVTYTAADATSGTVPTDSNAYVSGASVTVKGNTGNLAKTGYTFNGWSDGVNTYQAGGSFTITDNVTLTAVWEEDEPTPSIGNFNYFKVTSTSSITSGYYVIAVKLSDGYYGMTRTLANGKYAFSDKLTVSNNEKIDATNASGLEFEIKTVENGFTIKNLSTESYVKYSSSSNLDEQANEYTWSAANGTHGTFRLNSQTSSRALIARAGSNKVFGGYSTGNVSTTSDYYDVELFKAFSAEDFASNLSDKITCTASGSVAPAFAQGYSWSVLSGEFTSKLTEEQQNLLKDATYTKSGSGEQTVVTATGTTTQTIAEATAKYDYIVGKYFKTQGIETYNDFMGRNPDPVSGINTGLFALDRTNESASTSIIIIISIIGVTAIGGYFLLRKKKEQ